jgi:HK97 family phage portal protein
VLRKPNRYQNRIQFWENWILSKLNKGNTYVLKQRDARNVVVALYILDPDRVCPMIADDGSVFYQLSPDNLSGVTKDVFVPANEIIHDRMNCLFHPLVGISPLFANGLAATQGLNIQKNSIRLFENNSTPGGILTAPGEIGNGTAERLKADWEENFSGKNVGKVAVLGDGLKYEKMALTAVENQMIEQLKLTAEIVCSTYHVPGYKIGVGPVPNVSNVQSLNVEYYSQCLQRLVEDAELCLDEGLEMAVGTGTEFDTENLLRMDSVTQMEVLDKGKNVLTPNEARRKIDLPPKPGGDSVYRQQQDFSLEALAKRDAQDDPFASSKSPAPPAASQSAEPANDNAEQQRAMLALFEKDLREALNA